MYDCGATLSLDPLQRYRYRLWRRWRQGPIALFIMLNPSTADAHQDDPTIRRCTGFASLWDMAGFEVVNLFAYRATNPQELLGVDDPVGPENDQTIVDCCAKATKVVVAWGSHPLAEKRGQDIRILTTGIPLYCLGMTQNHSPRHPLYMAAVTKLVRWEPDGLQPGPPEEDWP